MVGSCIMPRLYGIEGLITDIQESTTHVKMSLKSISGKPLIFLLSQCYPDGKQVGPSFVGQIRCIGTKTVLFCSQLWHRLSRMRVSSIKAVWFKHPGAISTLRHACGHILEAVIPVQSPMTSSHRGPVLLDPDNGWSYIYPNKSHIIPTRAPKK